MPPRCLLGQAFVQPNLKKEAEELRIWISLLSPPPCEPDPLVMFVMPCAFPAQADASQMFVKLISCCL